MRNGWRKRAREKREQGGKNARGRNARETRAKNAPHTSIALARDSPFGGAGGSPTRPAFDNGHALI